VALAISPLRVISNHAVSFDTSQGGRTFADPDGDPLTYCVWYGPDQTAGPLLAFVPPVGEGRGNACITARDGRGGETMHCFEIQLVRNAVPKVARPNMALFATVGQHVNHDLTQGGATFTDADGDPLTYTVQIISPPGRGFTVEGLSAVGSLVQPLTAANFKIIADDGYGGTETDLFIVAIPGPLPGAPTLPATPYVYKDDQLQLPFDFRLSALTSVNPFWDTGSTQQNFPTNEGATLGRVLFYDKRLSILNTHSCGSCHEQARGFATAVRFATGVQAVPLRRNAMALANGRYNTSEHYFSDGRVFNFEQLAFMPIEDPLELGNSMPVVVEKLKATSYYPALFDAAFGSPDITPQRIATALAQFLRSILSYRTRFDQAYSRMDDPNAVSPPLPPPDPTQFLTPRELRGVQVFGDSGCTACHATTLQTAGGFFNTGLDLVPLDPGAGDGRFRVASLRNIALTAPYMHDGRFATLREVIEHYDRGVIQTDALPDGLREFRGGPVRRLNLSDQDKDALEAFFHTLTDTALTTDPKFADPF
jgi:cytochrome c peroxidase